MSAVKHSYYVNFIDANQRSLQRREKKFKNNSRDIFAYRVFQKYCSPPEISCLRYSYSRSFPISRLRWENEEKIQIYSTIFDSEGLLYGKN